MADLPVLIASLHRWDVIVSLQRSKFSFHPTDMMKSTARVKVMANDDEDDDDDMQHMRQVG